MTIEELQEKLLAETEKANAAAAEAEALKKQVADSEARITSLQEHNQKLFLKITTKTDDSKSEQKLTIKELVEKMKGDKK